MLVLLEILQSVKGVKTTYSNKHNGDNEKVKEELEVAELNCKICCKSLQK